MRRLARAGRELGVHFRTTQRQNLVVRDLRPGDVPLLFDLLHRLGLEQSGAERARNVVACPGAETCNLALTASRGVADATIDALVAAGLGDVPLSINVSGCPNSCGQQQMADIGLSGQVRRVGTDEAPGYRILLGGRVTEGGARFGKYVAKAPAKRTPEAVVAVVRRFDAERTAGERFGDWVDRVGRERHRARPRRLRHQAEPGRGPRRLHRLGLVARPSRSSWARASARADHLRRARHPLTRVAGVTDQPRRTGATVWMTGLPSSGKSTVANALAAALRERDVPVEILDGDEVREFLSKGLGYSREDRVTNISRIGFVADLLARNGVIAISAAIAPHAEVREAVRRRHEASGAGFLEVYLSAPVEVTSVRDVKGLYAKQARGEMTGLTGVDDPYDVPESPDVVLPTHTQTLDESVQTLLDALTSRGLL